MEICLCHVFFNLYYSYLVFQDSDTLHEQFNATPLKAKKTQHILDIQSLLTSDEQRQFQIHVVSYEIAPQYIFTHYTEYD